MQAWLNYWLPIPFNWPSSLEQFAGFYTEVYLKGWSLTKFVSLLLLWHFPYFWKCFHHWNPVCFCVSWSYFMFLIKSPCDRSTFPCDWGWYGLFFVISIFLFFTKLFHFTVKLFSSITLKCPTVSVLWSKTFLSSDFTLNMNTSVLYSQKPLQQHKKVYNQISKWWETGKIYVKCLLQTLVKQCKKLYKIHKTNSHPTHNSTFKAISTFKTKENYKITGCIIHSKKKITLE